MNVMTFGTAALLATAGAALADQPMMLSDAQLDYITAGNTGGGIFNTGTITIIDSTIPGSGGMSMTLGDGSVRITSHSISLSISPSPGTTTRPAEFVVINVGQKP
jgi:hypothetical protein